MVVFNGCRDQCLCVASRCWRHPILIHCEPGFRLYETLCEVERYRNSGQNAHPASERFDCGYLSAQSRQLVRSSPLSFMMITFTNDLLKSVT